MLKVMKSNPKRMENYNTFGAGPPISRPSSVRSSQLPRQQVAAERELLYEKGQQDLEDREASQGSTSHRFKIGHLDMSSKLTQFNLLAK